jgi:hypothetical protein
VDGVYLVERRPDPRDGRVNLAAATGDAARELCENREWLTGLLSRLRSQDVDTVRAPSSFSSAPRQPPSQYRRIIGVSCGLIADQSCYSRSVNPFSSVYNTAIRPSRTCATS